MHMNSHFKCLFRAKLHSFRFMFSHETMLPKNKPENKTTDPVATCAPLINKFNGNISKSPVSGLDCGLTDDFVTDCCRFYECI